MEMAFPYFLVNPVNPDFPDFSRRFLFKETVPGAVRGTVPGPGLVPGLVPGTASAKKAGRTTAKKAEKKTRFNEVWADKPNTDNPAVAEEEVTEEKPPPGPPEVGCTIPPEPDPKDQNLTVTAFAFQMEDYCKDAINLY